MNLKFTQEKLLDPIIASWVLKRLDNIKKINAQEAADIENQFNDVSLWRLLKANNSRTLTDLFFTLKPEKFLNLVPELIKRWDSWEDTVASWSANVMSKIAPKEFLKLTNKYLLINNFNDINKLLGISKGLCDIEPSLGKKQAEKFIEEIYLKHKKGFPEILDLEIFRVANHFKLEILPELLLDIINKNQNDNKEFKNKLTGVYSVLSGDLPYLEYVSDCRDKITKQKFKDISVFLEDNAPIHEINRLIFKSGQEIIQKIPELMPSGSEYHSNLIESLGIIASSIDSESDKEKLDSIGLFALGLLVTIYTKESYNFQQFTLPDLVNIAASDLRSLPCYNQIVESIESFQRKEIVETLIKAIKQYHNTYGEVHIAEIMGDIGYQEFVDVLISCTTKDCGDFVCEKSVNSLSKIGSASEMRIITRWKDFDSSQKIYCANVLELIGGKETVCHLLNLGIGFDPSLEEIWCNTALRVPDKRLIQVLIPELKRKQSFIDDTFLTMCLLLDYEHPELSEVRKREMARNKRYEDNARALKSGHFEDLIDKTIKLSLICDSCGKDNSYEVETVIMTPDIDKAKPFIADELTCLSCEKDTTFTFSANGYLALTAEILKMQMLSEKDVTYEGPLKILSLSIINGKKVSPEEAITYYRRKLKEDPNDIRNLLGMGNILLNLVRINKAIDCYEKCLLIDPNCVEAAFSLSKIFYDESKYKEALNILKTALDNSEYWNFYKLGKSTPEKFKQVFIENYNTLRIELNYTSAPLFHPAYMKKSKKIKRNSPCPCGSGKKYKHCCLGKK